jgi:uncharacterized protein
MAEIQTDRMYAFRDSEGTYVLDIMNSRPFLYRGVLDDVADLAASFPEPSAPAYRPLDYMRAQLCVTHSCNLRCIYCELDGDPPAPRRKTMDLATAAMAIEHILARKPASARRVVISLTSNGETLLNFDMVEGLIDYCDSIADTDFSFCFATNGTLLTRPLLERIVRRPNLAIFFSLDGNETEQACLRPYADGRTSYQDVISAIELYKEVTRGYPGRELASSTVITTFNLDIEAIYRHMAELGFRNILTRPVRSRPEWDFGLREDTLERYKDAYTRFYYFLNRTIDEGEYMFVESMTPAYDFFARAVYALMLEEKKMYCAPHLPPAGAGARLEDFSLTYDADGTLICPCRDVIGMAPFRIGSFDEGIDREVLAAVDRLHCDGKPECAGCWSRYLCGGGCYLQSYYANGDISRPDTVMCELTRHVSRLGMKFVLHLQESHHELYSHLKNRGMERVPWHVIYGR